MDPMDDDFYGLLDVVFENTKAINGLMLFPPDDIGSMMATLLVSSFLARINRAIELANPEVVTSMRAALTSDRAEELFYLIALYKNEDPRLATEYERLSFGIHDASLIAMRMHAYGLSRETAQRQVMEFTSNPIGILAEIQSDETRRIAGEKSPSSDKPTWLPSDLREAVFWFLLLMVVVSLALTSALGLFAAVIAIIILGLSDPTNTKD